MNTAQCLIVHLSQYITNSSVRALLFVISNILLYIPYIVNAYVIEGAGFCSLYRGICYIVVCYIVIQVYLH